MRCVSRAPSVMICKRRMALIRKDLAEPIRCLLTTSATKSAPVRAVETHSLTAAPMLYPALRNTLATLTCSALTATVGYAQSVAMTGVMGSKALLVINGSPKALSANESHRGAAPHPGTRRQRPH